MTLTFSATRRFIPTLTQGVVRCQERLGRLLKYYHKEAA